MVITFPVSCAFPSRKVVIAGNRPNSKDESINTTKMLWSPYTIHEYIITGDLENRQKQQ